MILLIGAVVLICFVDTSFQQFSAYPATGRVEVYSPFTAVEPIFTSNVYRFGYQMRQSPISINSQLDETYRLTALYYFLNRLNSAPFGTYRNGRLSVIAPGNVLPQVFSGRTKPNAAPAPAQAPAPAPAPAPVISPEGGTPDKKPEGETPAGKPDGETPAEKPDGETPAEKPDGETPAEKPEGGGGGGEGEGVSK